MSNEHLNCLPLTVDLASEIAVVQLYWTSNILKNTVESTYPNIFNIATYIFQPPNYNNFQITHYLYGFNYEYDKLVLELRVNKYEINLLDNQSTTWQQSKQSMCRVWNLQIPEWSPHSLTAWITRLVNKFWCKPLHN